VAQKGSLVEPDRLRFDFSHTKPMSREEIAEVEAIANRIVQQNDPVTTRLMTVDAAIAEGAMALFGEKYGDEVRVVSMGRNGEGASRPIYSLELCGGTHVARTGDIGLIKILADSASSAGVRRMEALAGNAARAYLDQQDRRVAAASAALKVAPADLVPRIEALMEERRKLERELAEAKKALALGGSAGGGDAIETVNGRKFLVIRTEGLGNNELKGLADEGKKRVGSGVVAVANVSDGKASLIVGVTDDLSGSLSAVDLVRAGAAAIGGKGGGGRPDLAQAGGPNGTKADEALAAIKAAIS
jgi:alanyl-tRNA synthetase